jgi:hypothetical protein
MRLPMHPADQFDAFKKLADDGKGPEEIAARFGTTAKIVAQRLKLAVDGRSGATRSTASMASTGPSPE